MWLVITLVAVGGYLVLPSQTLDGWLITGYKTLIGCLAGVALVAGVLKRRPRATLAWLLFGFGITANASELWSPTSTPRCSAGLAIRTSPTPSGSCSTPFSFSVLSC